MFIYTLHFTHYTLCNFFHGNHYFRSR